MQTKVCLRRKTSDRSFEEIAIVTILEKRVKVSFLIQNIEQLKTVVVVSQFHI